MTIAFAYNSHTRIVHEISRNLSIDVINAIWFVNMFQKMASSSNPCKHLRPQVL